MRAIALIVGDLSMRSCANVRTCKHRNTQRKNVFYVSQGVQRSLDGAERT